MISFLIEYRGVDLYQPHIGPELRGRGDRDCGHKS
jgi:hypothetical protein